VDGQNRVRYQSRLARQRPLAASNDENSRATIQNVRGDSSAFYCGLRACEIKGIRWEDVDWTNRLLHIRRSKTPAGWRSPTLNKTCLHVLQELFDRASKLGFAQADHFVFPWHGRSKRLDPTKPMASWRTAWRSIRKAAGLKEVRFHDGRHTAITTLAEKGLPDWVIQAQVGHVAPEMMKTYSHIRRQALNQAADALEPAAAASQAPPPTTAAMTKHASRAKRVMVESGRGAVTCRTGGA
jgi:integrase